MKRENFLTLILLALIITSAVSISGCAEISTNGDGTKVNISDDILNDNSSDSGGSKTIPDLPKLPGMD